MPSVQHKRGTRAQVNAAATANGLKVGEVYLITDEARLAVGTSVNSYQDFAKLSEAGGGGGGGHTYYAMTQADYTLANSTAVQRVFNGSASGALTLATGTYDFEMMLYITAMGSTSGNVGFSLIGAGTAAIAGSRSMIRVMGVDSSTPNNAGAQNGRWQPGPSGVVLSAPVVSATTGTAAAFSVTGILDVGTAGTIIPSVNLQNAISTARINTGSHFIIRRIANTATATVGSWS
jgi:hypothetical protein